MPKGNFGGFPTYWTTFGQGPRAGLLIHCSLGETAIWGGLAAELSGAATLTAFDLPGHGRSGDWDGEGEMSALCAAMAADLAQRDAPVDVVGHSFGGVVALKLAIERPELVRSLVIIEPVFFAAGADGTPGEDLLEKAQMRGVATAMAAGDLPAAGRSFIATWGGGRPWESFKPEAQARIAAQMPLIAAAGPALYEDVGGLLEPGVLEGVTQPVLLLEGSDAPAIIPAIMAGLAARLPKVRRGVIGGAGHMSVATHPAQIGAEVLRFWREI
ncbi:alpha/beta fold hydrolase [Roseovarius aquimarinus]|uniref:Alpha/beta fold hydrolase n=1 Tax=Roseovarius aquimarinus TaxID=1229156 RepID=A0ABW7I5N7_9RHOB